MFGLAVLLSAILKFIDSTFNFKSKEKKRKTSTPCYKTNTQNVGQPCILLAVHGRLTVRLSEIMNVPPPQE